MSPDRDIEWPKPADDPHIEASHDGPQGRPPPDDEVFNREDLMPRGS